MVKSEKVYSPQEYLEAITGQYYTLIGDDDIQIIQKILNYNGLELWDYPLNDIDHLVKNNINVVLVDCLVFNECTKEFKHQHRWFEVPEDFKEEN